MSHAIFILRLIFLMAIILSMNFIYDFMPHILCINSNLFNDPFAIFLINT